MNEDGPELTRNIAYLSPSRIPSRQANSIHVMKMCQAFVQEGHQPILVALRGADAGPDTQVDLQTHYGVTEQFDIVRFRRLRGLRGHDYCLRSALYALRGRFDLVYARDLGPAAVCATMSLPTIFETHDVIRKGNFRSSYFQKLLRGQGLRRIVVISRALKDHYLTSYPHFLNESNVVVAPDGVDLERFAELPTSRQAKIDLGLDPDRFTVGYCGHLYAGRGIELILALAERLPDARFAIVGGNDEDVADATATAGRRGINNATFFGFVPNAHVPRYLAASDVLLMPYQRRVAVTSAGRGDTTRWMSPMKLFEYMAAGRMIVSSDLPVLREVLNERNAVFCDPEDVEAWCAAVERAANDVPWRERLARRAAADVEAYTWRKRVRRIVASV